MSQKFKTNFKSNIAPNVAAKFLNTYGVVSSAKLQISISFNAKKHIIDVNIKRFWTKN